MLVNGAEYRYGAICTSTPTIVFVLNSPELQLVIGVRGGLGGIAKVVLARPIHPFLLKCNLLAGCSRMCWPDVWSDERIPLLFAVNLIVLRHRDRNWRPAPDAATYSSCITDVVFFLRVRSALWSRRSVTMPL